MREAAVGSNTLEVMTAALAALRGRSTVPDTATSVVRALTADGMLRLAWISAPGAFGIIPRLVADGEAAAVATLTAAASSEPADWPAICERSGLRFRGAWPLGSDLLPGAVLGVADGDRPLHHGEDAALAEVALATGRAIDAATRHEALHRIVAGAGRVGWLVAIQAASRVARHDLGNMLMAMSLFQAELAADVPAGSTSAADVAAIGEAVERGNRLVEQLRLLAHEPDLEVAPVDPASVALASVQLLEIVARPCALAVTVTEPSTVRASRRFLMEALVQLVANARDAADGAVAAPVAITVRVEARSLTAEAAGGLAAGPYAVVTVTDDGPGMSPEVRARAAEPGFTTRPEALGLGLAAVRAGAEAAGGALELLSAPGAGTTVRLLLPAVDAQPSSPTGDGRA